MKSIQFNDCRKAINQAKYSATAERKKVALKLLAKLTKEISCLEEVAEPVRYAREETPKESVLAKKARRAKGSRSSNARLERKAQAISLKAKDKRCLKSEPSKRVVCDGIPTKASPFGTRKEVVSTPQRKPKAKATLVCMVGESPKEAYFRLKEVRRMESAKAEVMEKFESVLCTEDEAFTPKHDDAMSHVTERIPF